MLRVRVSLGLGLEMARTPMFAIAPLKWVTATYVIQRPMHHRYQPVGRAKYWAECAEQP